MLAALWSLLSNFKVVSWLFENYVTHVFDAPAIRASWDCWFLYSGAAKTAVKNATTDKIVNAFILKIAVKLMTWKTGRRGSLYRPSIFSLSECRINDIAILGALSFGIQSINGWQNSDRDKLSRRTFKSVRRIRDLPNLKLFYALILPPHTPRQADPLYKPTCRKIVLSCPIGAAPSF